VENAITDSGYTAAEIDIMGQKYGVIMKNELCDAMIDPSGEDANVLKSAGKGLCNKLACAYTKKQLKPLETSLERTLFNRYVSSLLMNLVKYPTDEPNEEVLAELGLNDKEISKLYIRAAAAWLGSTSGVEKVVKSINIVSSIENISFTGKKTVIINMDIHSCREGSHYVLKLSCNRQQTNVQLDVPKLSETYKEIEEQITSFVIRNAKSEIVRENAVNLIRLYLNTTVCYEAGKPLPLEWNK